jgi:heterodisulfide reductase subunit C
VREEMLKANPEFLEAMSVAGSFNASACINCGACTALCPIGINLLPRKLFRYVLIGAEEKVLENIPLIYSCLLCRMCEDNCPAEVRIAENVRTLRTYINRKVYGIGGS